jgi:prepilin-type N-terminal cleavage/methylation domain-containing protein
MNSRRGFTLIEVLVVVSVIALMMTFLFLGFNDGRGQSRDAKRQADLRNLQTAVQAYRSEHGRYPAGCNGAGNWSGELGGAWDCGDGTNQYIVGHEPGINFAPRYIRSIPSDPKRVDANSGYAYLTNAEGTVYKLVVFRSVEEFSAIDSDNPPTRLNERFGDFRLCNFVAGSSQGEYQLCSGDDDGAPGIGSYTDYGPGVAPTNCNHTRSEVRDSYALWGGFANADGNRQSRIQTEQVICVEPS